MRWTTATVAALTTGAIGVATESHTLILFPLFALAAIGLIQEWVGANAHQNETKYVEEIPAKRPLSVVAANLHSGGQPHLEGVIYPLTEADEQPAETDKNGGLVFNTLEVDGHRNKQKSDTCHGDGLVPIVDDERLKRVGHGEVANALLCGGPH